MFFYSALLTLLATLKHLRQFFSRKGVILLPLVTSLIGITPGLSPAQALEFPPTKKGAPARTSGGGVRDPKDVLSVLLPDSGIHSFGSDRVTIFVNVPQGVSQEGFLLVFNDDETLFEQEFQLPKSAGLVGVTLPRSVVESMTLNQIYNWELAVLPDGVIQQEEQVAIGQVQRVDMNTDAGGKSDDPLVSAEYYAQLSIWQETLEAIAPLRQEYLEEWQDLLLSVELKSLIEVPWVGFISLEDS